MALLIATRFHLEARSESERSVVDAKFKSANGWQVFDFIAHSRDQSRFLSRAGEARTNGFSTRWPTIRNIDCNKYEIRRNAAAWAKHTSSCHGTIRRHHDAIPGIVAKNYTSASCHRVGANNPKGRLRVDFAKRLTVSNRHEERGINATRNREVRI